MFYPQPIGEEPRAPAGWTLEDIAFTAADGTVLAGVLAKPGRARPALVVYYGGNAEEAGRFAASAGQLYGEHAALFMNYRGYGRSGGKPGERALVEDSLRILDWVRTRKDIDGERIALHGRSLGTGVAVQVAAARPVRCVVLTSPFSSARAVAARAYPWLPVRWLMRHPFDSMRHGPAIEAPALMLVGEADDLIPRSQSDQLAAAWGGPARVLAFSRTGHDAVPLAAGHDAAIREFLDRSL